MTDLVRQRASPEKPFMFNAEREKGGRWGKKEKEKREEEAKADEAESSEQERRVEDETGEERKGEVRIILSKFIKTPIEA